VNRNLAGLFEVRWSKLSLIIDDKLGMSFITQCSFNSSKREA
jgi:hypothetical protein